MFGKGRIVLGVALLLSSAFGFGKVSDGGTEAMAEDIVSPRIDFSYSETVQQGNWLSLEVYGEGIKGLAALTVTFVYPTDSFYNASYGTYWIDEEWGCTYHINNPSEGRIVYSIVSMGDKGIDTESHVSLFSISLLARENAEVGACRLECNVGEAYNYNLQPMSIPSTHHFVKIEERSVAPSLQRLSLNGYVTGHNETEVTACVYGDWTYDISAFRCSIVYDKSVLSFKDLTLSSDLLDEGIYSVNSDTDGVVLISYASTRGHYFCIDELRFAFRRSYAGVLAFHVSMEEVYDSSNRPVLCDPKYFETTIESTTPMFSIGKVLTSEPEFYVDLRISERSHIAAADLGLRFDPNYLCVSGIESKIGTGEMISFDRRREADGMLPFSYINVNGLEAEKVLARVYFHVVQPYKSFSSVIQTYVDHVVNLSFEYLPLRTSYFEVKYNFELTSLVLLSEWDGDIDITSSRAFYVLKNERFRLKVNGTILNATDYGSGDVLVNLDNETVTALTSGLIKVDLGSKVYLRGGASYSDSVVAYAKRAQGFVTRISNAVGDMDLHKDAFSEEQMVLLKALMKEYASYSSELYPYLNPALLSNGLNVGECIDILRTRLNTAPKLGQKKLNFVVPMGGTFTAKIDVEDEEDVLTFSIPSLPSIGSVSIDSDGVLTFKGHRGHFGSEEFKVVISDGVSNVILPVKAVVMDNQAPVAPSEKSIILSEYSSYRGKVDAADPDGDALSYAVSLKPGHGTLTLDENTGIFVYQPEWGFFGFDSFAIDIDDGNHELTQHYYANITENKKPTAESIRFVAKRGEEYVGKFKASDPEDGILTFSIFEYPNEGSLLVFDNGTFVYKPLAYSTSSDYFSIKVSDGYTYAILTAQISILF